MAYNVFGNPITNETLSSMVEYEGKTITRFDRAKVAYDMKNVQDKDKNAREYVENLKRESGDGVSTLCLIYNATGDTITHITDYDWHGYIWKAPYPFSVANGQWFAFLHVKTSGSPSGSAAAVVYGGLNNNDERCEWMLSWSNPWTAFYNNKAYTEIREESHYTEHDYWGFIYDKLEDSGLTHTDRWNGCVSTVSMGNDKSPIFEGICTLDGIV